MVALIKIKGAVVRHKLLVIAISLTPILGIIEILSLFPVITFSTTVYLLIGLKSLKDLLLFSIVMLPVVFGSPIRLRSNRFPLVILCSLSLISIGLSFLSSNSNTVQILSGLRWLLPLIIYFSVEPPNKTSYAIISKRLFQILILSLILQIIQALFMKGIYGINSVGISIRNPGIFLIPSTMAGFSVATLGYNLRFRSGATNQNILFLICGLSIFLTGSGTGIVSYFLLFLFYKLNKNVNLVSILVKGLILLSVIIPSLAYFTNRKDILTSPIGRIAILKDNFQINNIIVSNRFGEGTNTFVSWNSKMLNIYSGEIADSMITSIIINLGVLSLFLIINYLFIKPFKQSKYLGVTNLIMFGPFFITTVIFESFPLNLLMILYIIKSEK